MELRSCITSEFKESVPRTKEFDIGYYKPCRGSTKVWIKSNEDMQCMYDSHKDEINIWCEGRVQDEVTDSEFANTSTKKRHKGDDDSAKPGSRRQAIRDEVEKIFFDLKEEHGSKYTAQQYRLWANMLQIGTWKDNDNPPQTPMFGCNGKTPTKSTSLTDALSSVAEGLVRALSHLLPSHLHMYAPSLMKWVFRLPNVHPFALSILSNSNSFISYLNLQP